MAQKPNLKTRTASTSTVTETAVAGTALTHAELDSNLINLRDGTFGLVGDDSTGILVQDGDTIKITGAGGTTVTSSGDTITITGGGDTGDIVFSGNEISTGSSNANLVLTASGTGILEMKGGTHTIQGQDGVDFRINPFGNAGLIIDDNYSDGNFFTQDYQPDRFIQAKKRMDDLTDVSVKRLYYNRFSTEQALTNQTSSSSNARFRNMVSEISVDLNGSTITPSSSYNSRGPQSYYGEVKVDNTSASKATLSHLTHNNMWLDVSADTGEIEITEQAAIYGGNADYTGSGGTTIANHMDFMGGMVFTDGDTAMTNYYTLYAKDDVGASGGVTNKYLISAENQDFLSEIGTLQQYKEKIVAITEDSSAGGIAVDCSLAPVFTNSLDSNTTFVITNLGTGKTVTIIITQGGANTATFVGSDSTAVKFPGGAPTITTTSGKIDVVTIFNDGTNLLGNIAQDFTT